MIFIITGASHTGKTMFSQKLLEKYQYPYISIDHLKMGLIRSRNTNLTPLSCDNDLTNYLWPIVLEMIKTAIENNQNLIVEGCYVPFDWKTYFSSEYLKHIKYYCLIMSEKYIDYNFDNIVKYANVIENRLSVDLDKEQLKKENIRNLEEVIKNDLNYILIDDEYNLNE